jgi:glucose dehydrogenase
VANGVIYGITNWSIVFAVDARTGKEKWRWDPWVNQTRCVRRSAAASSIAAWRSTRA